jgi:hypothetical protein
MLREMIQHLHGVPTCLGMIEKCCKKPVLDYRSNRESLIIAG